MHAARWWAAICVALPLALGCDKGGEQQDGQTREGTAVAETQQATDQAASADAVARGDYLVNVLLGCNDCHTPFGPDRLPVQERHLAGVECMFDLIPPADNGRGCLNVPNITNHASGLRNWTDAEVIGAVRNGIRPGGAALNSIMPYPVYHNLSDEDAGAVVAYLRTLPGVDHSVPLSEPPLGRPERPADPVDISGVYSPAADHPEYESAMRGRYLAVGAGACIDCHTPQSNPDDLSSPVSPDRAFAGGRAFPLAAAGLPSPPFPEVILTSNVTSDATGIAGWTVDDVVRVMREGVQKSGSHVCPPMPSGPMGAFARMTDQDARDIANYILSLPPVANDIEDNCDPAAGPPGEGPPPAEPSGAPPAGEPPTE